VASVWGVVGAQHPQLVGQQLLVCGGRTRRIARLAPKPRQVATGDDGAGVIGAEAVAGGGGKVGLGGAGGGDLPGVAQAARCTEQHLVGADPARKPHRGRPTPGLPQIKSRYLR